MMDYLVFTLAAPIASFGTVAVGERRPTWDRPSKSQVLGLVAGSLGIERGEELRHTALAQGLLFAVRVDSAGQFQADYHTTQAPPARRNRRFATRADELSVPKSEMKTILSRRENRVGSFYTIALWPQATTDGLPTLREIADALRCPAFPPFAGRKANVLVLPMAPRIVSSADVAAAFTAYDANEPAEQRNLRAHYWLAAHTPDGRIYAEAGSVPPDRIQQIEQRRDTPESRAKWRFDLRAEALLKSTSPGGKA